MPEDKSLLDKNSGAGGCGMLLLFFALVLFLLPAILIEVAGGDRFWHAFEVSVASNEAWVLSASLWFALWFFSRRLSRWLKSRERLSFYCVGCGNWIMEGHAGDVRTTGTACPYCQTVNHLVEGT